MNINEQTTLSAWDENEILLKSVVNEYIHDNKLNQTSKNEIQYICSVKIKEFKGKRFSYPSFNDLNRRFLEEMCQYVQNTIVKQKKENNIHVNTQRHDTFSQDDDTIQLIHEKRNSELNIKLKEKEHELTQFDNPPPKEIDFSDKSDEFKTIDSLLEEEMKRRNHEIQLQDDHSKKDVSTNENKLDFSTTNINSPWNELSQNHKINIKDEVSKLFFSEKDVNSEKHHVNYERIETKPFHTRSILKQSTRKQLSRWVFDIDINAQDNRCINISTSYLNYVFNRIFNEPSDASCIEVSLKSLLVKCSLPNTNYMLKMTDVKDDNNTSLAILNKRLGESYDYLYDVNSTFEIQYQEIKNESQMPIFRMDPLDTTVDAIHIEMQFTKSL